jgi:hypothetical protein
MGKMQLAVTYAKRHRGDYSAVIFWLNARDETMLKQGFVRLAERILREHPLVVYVGNAVQSRDLDKTVGAVKRWLDKPKNNWQLIMCDNYDNPVLERRREARLARQLAVDEVDGDINSISQSYDIRPFLPDTHHRIPTTTRFSL